MNYERRFKRFTRDLLDLIEKHIKEWDEAESGGFDIDAEMDKVNSDTPAEPVIYPKSKPQRKKKNP